MVLVIRPGRPLLELSSPLSSSHCGDQLSKHGTLGDIIDDNYKNNLTDEIRRICGSEWYENLK